jgi:hypothetical protein
VYNEAKVDDKISKIPSNIKCNFVLDEVSANDPSILYQSLNIMSNVDSGELEMTSCGVIKRH